MDEKIVVINLGYFIATPVLGFGLPRHGERLSRRCLAIYTVALQHEFPRMRVGRFRSVLVGAAREQSA